MSQKFFPIPRKTICTCLAMLLMLPITAIALEASLQDVIVTNTRDHLLVYLKVEGAFREKVKKAVLTGVPLSFSFIIELYRVRDYWLDKRVASNKVTHTVKYDNLKKEFNIERSWETGDPIRTKSFERAKELMTEVDSLKVVPLSELRKGSQYQLRAKAELSKQTLPFYLHYVLFFVSMWDFETDWYALDFIF
jgi:hypothetical protein